jgi:MFS superfamily sulfate permease-like transporter
VSERPRQRPLSGLSRSNVASELVAGVTLPAIAVPLNIGYAQIAGLPPTAGLYALILPAIVYALLVSSGRSWPRRMRRPRRWWRRPLADSRPRAAPTI